MKKLLALFLLIGVGFFATGYWPNMWSSLRSAIPFPSSLMPNFWGPREIAGLRLDLPCSLGPFNAPTKPPVPNIHVDYFRGRAGSHIFFLTHATNSSMAGGLMLSWLDKPLGTAADKLKFDVMSTNSVTTMIGGFRARRSDYVSQRAPRVRVRCLLLERANQFWFVECHAPESDPGAEGEFLRIARSVREP